MRQGGYGDKIELMVENREEHHKALPLRLKREAPKKPVKQEDEDDIADAWAARDDALADLALERGEKPGRLSKANKDLITEKIKERAGTPQAPTPPTRVEGESHMAIEGHVPQSRDRPQQQHDDDDEDDEHDWDKHLPT